MNTATKKFEHFVVKHCSTKFFTCDDNHSPKCKSLYNRLLFIHSVSAVRATAWLTVLDGTQPTVFDNDIDTGLRV